MISLAPSFIRRRRIARDPVLVAACAGTTRDAASSLLPQVEALMHAFDLAPLMRMRQTSRWRFFEYAMRLPLIAHRTISIEVAHVTKGSVFDDAPNLDMGDTITFRHKGPEGEVRVDIERMEDLLWGLMTARQVVREAGLLAAHALAVLRSFASGAGEVAIEDAMDACRLASLHHHRARVAASRDALAMLGPHRDMADFVPVWSIDVEPGVVRMRPVIEKADPDNINAVEMLRMTAGDERILEASRRCGIQAR